MKKKLFLMALLASTAFSAQATESISLLASTTQTLLNYCVGAALGYGIVSSFYAYAPDSFIFGTNKTPILENDATYNDSLYRQAQGIAIGGLAVVCSNILCEKNPTHNNKILLCIAPLTVAAIVLNCRRIQSRNIEGPMNGPLNEEDTLALLNLNDGEKYLAA